MMRQHIVLIVIVVIIVLLQRFYHSVAAKILLIQLFVFVFLLFPPLLPSSKSLLFSRLSRGRTSPFLCASSLFPSKTKTCCCSPFPPRASFAVGAEKETQKKTHTRKTRRSFWNRKKAFYVFFLFLRRFGYKQRLFGVQIILFIVVVLLLLLLLPPKKERRIV